MYSKTNITYKQKDDASKYRSEYYKLNRDRILNRVHGSSVFCKCCNHRYTNYDDHLKTTKHKYNFITKNGSFIVSNVNENNCPLVV
jgi:hypothetical protein